RDADGSLVGGLASNWDQQSARDYTITVRDDATCADGTPITASIVAESLGRLADPDVASAWKNLVFGPGDPEISADDDAGTVQVKLASDYTTFLRALAIPQAGIVCPAGVNDTEGLTAGSVEGAFSGPYVLTEADDAKGYELTLREDYEAWPEFR